MTQYLGVDIGTTRTKVGCFDTMAGRLVALRAAPTPVEDDSFGGRRSADLVVTVVSDLVRRLLDDTAVKADRLGGLAVGSVGEEVVLRDADGAVTGPVLAWHGDHGRVVKPALPAGEHGVLDDTFSVFKLAWLARERPDELAAAVTFTSLADHVAQELLGAGMKDAVMNVSHSSRTGLVDLESLELRGDVLDGVGAGHLRLPRLVASGTVIGRAAGGSPLPIGLPVATGGHDHWCGAFGAGVRSAGEVYVSAGTSEAQVMLVDRLPAAPEVGVDVGAFVANDLRYLHRATPSGRIYQAWHAMLFDSADDSIMWSEVSAVVDDVAPAEVTRDRRAVQLASLPLDATRAQAMASVLKGLAVEAEQTTARLEQVAGRLASRVTVAGVPASSAVWQRMRRAASGRDLTFVTEPEVTVLGVALLAQLGVEGHADSPTLASRNEGVHP